VSSTPTCNCLDRGTFVQHVACAAGRGHDATRRLAELDQHVAGVAVLSHAAVREAMSMHGAGLAGMAMEVFLEAIRTSFNDQLMSAPAHQHGPRLAARIHAVAYRTAPYFMRSKRAVLLYMINPPTRLSNW
jgi:hypothetical protein